MDPNTDINSDESQSVQALQWARVLQIIKQHGITGVIIILLFYQLGFFAQAQSVGCGI